MSPRARGSTRIFTCDGGDRKAEIRSHAERAPMPPEPFAYSAAGAVWNCWAASAACAAYITDGPAPI